MKMLNQSVIDYFDGIESYSACKTHGEQNARRAYLHTTRQKASMFAVQEIPSVIDVPDFVHSLRKAGVSEIALISVTGDFMNVLKAMENAGCRIMGIVSVTYQDDCGDVMDADTVNALGI